MAVFTPLNLNAQSWLAYEGRAGVVLPVGELDGLADPGASVGVSLVKLVTGRFGVRADLGASFLNDQVDALGVVPSPPLTVATLEGGFELDIPPPQHQQFPLSVRLRAMVGAAYVWGSADYGDGTTVEIDEIRPSVGGGFALGYRPDEQLEIFVDGVARLVILSAETTAVFAQRSREVRPFEHAWFIPLSLGVRFRK